MVTKFPRLSHYYSTCSFAFGFFLLLAGIMTPRAMAASDLWAFPETMTDKVWSFLAVPSTEETGNASPMDGKPGMANPTGTQGAYFLSTDPLTQISETCIHPGNNHDAVLVWTAPRAGKAQILATWHVATSASEGNKVSVRVEKILVDGSTSKLKDETVNHNEGTKVVKDVDVLKGDKITFRLGNGGDGNSCDSTSFSAEITFAK
jgi:hypothetical protein